jgi:hypothetical protein
VLGGGTCGEGKTAVGSSGIAAEFPLRETAIGVINVLTMWPQRRHRPCANPVSL